MRVQVSERALDVLRDDDPETGTQARFSMEHAVAGALARPRVSLHEFEADAVDDPTVESLRERVAAEAGADLSYTDLRLTVTV